VLYRVQLVIQGEVREEPKEIVLLLVEGGVVARKPLDDKIVHVQVRSPHSDPLCFQVPECVPELLQDKDDLLSCRQGED
jgi:hypothetical protein